MKIFIKDIILESKLFGRTKSTVNKTIDSIKNKEKVALTTRLNEIKKIQASNKADERFQQHIRNLQNSTMPKELVQPQPIPVSIPVPQDPLNPYNKTKNFIDSKINIKG